MKANLPLHVSVFLDLRGVFSKKPQVFMVLFGLKQVFMVLFGLKQVFMILFGGIHGFVWSKSYIHGSAAIVSISPYTMQLHSKRIDVLYAVSYIKHK